MRQEVLLKIDMTEMLSIMTASIVKRLHGFGMSYEQIADVREKSSSLISRRIDSIKQRCSDDLDTMFSEGIHDEFHLLNNARATFALAGVEVADSVRDSLIAERN